jgi:glycosyltransferase involved in cell wall biosynthesis
MSRLRVMHVVVAGDIGGAERLLTDLARRPEETGADHEVALITPNRRLASFLAGAGLVVHDRGPARESPVAYLRQAFGSRDVEWIASLVSTRKADVVHTHTFGSHVVGTRAARRAGAPQLRTEHHVMHYFDPSASPFTRWAAHRTDRLVAVSEYVRRVLGETAPAVAARTTVVRNGVDTAYWAPRDRTGGEFRAAVVCRLTPWKRVHLAIDAAARASIPLLIIGDGAERAALEARAAKQGARVTFTGYVPDPREAIASADVVVSASDREPLGLSVLESLSMGRPVVAFAGGGIPEIVEDGVTGWLVREATGDAFAAALERARSCAPLAEMSHAARRFACEHGSIEQMCRGYAESYRSVLRPS